ncbi:hypothetical protein COX22_01050 [Candidatus Falkowbacteria bacterium CG23_combo_of_CG06-09_8_20_14_all_49_15]|uniref:Uncharacterized protein n=1 Tax=Candidatus Falkowbacteria bacterium CG23_combo_of_CG06-09_8_20_14_all_49_15 TaxID=1974572 RepID=A0A2G9ZLJ5_9BACT|nr:MAG: hypothetical protein COX22_01050 [Candidatus Falkowbacteria bacterium CG23_combo_of_CG06-09_8_20_14_all_49_15]
MSNLLNNDFPSSADDLKPDQAVWPEQEPPDPEKIQRPPGAAAPETEEAGLLPPVYGKTALPPSSAALEPLFPKPKILPVLAATEKIQLADLRKKIPALKPVQPEDNFAGRFRAKLKKILAQRRGR